MPRPLVVFGLLLLAIRAGAQGDPMRPWTAWRTIETAHYRIHFPAEYERWVADAARRVEGIDSAIARTVGFRTTERVDVVVHDPYTVSNGYVLPLLEHAVSVWWATPPDPRNDIGNYRTWSEMLATHELTHIAHLMRPSRNAWDRFKWSLMPTSVGPIARKAPRWVTEGYPTVVEGRITGLGRPNGVWRPALLRQWAIEGMLPSYAAMSSSRSFQGGAFAYLNGSAFLEWLLNRQGDSSLTHVWRRMTAVTERSFDQAFSGVYGEPPAILYGQHTAELTANAMRAKADLERAGLREGELVQRLTWETGDPAISPEGDRVALTLKSLDAPSRLVVWSTRPDSAPAVTRRAPRPNRDPEDVADQPFYPAARRVLRSLSASYGNAFLYPRWFADNRRIMVSHWSSRPDGTSGPDAYIWNTATGSVTRLTNGENVLMADPSPDSREAVAMRCHEGHCDIVRLYFTIGSVTSLLEGNPTRSYYRPRFSPDGQKFVASVADSGRWSLVVANRDGRNARRVGPDDGVNRYDAQWTGGSDSLIVVSERGGVPNLEYVSLDGGAKSITRVTGAAVAPELNREDHSIWFLSMHARGFDVRRIEPGAVLADSAVSVDGDRYGYAGMQHVAATPLPFGRSLPADDYGAGVSRERWLPGAFGGADGFGVTLGLFRGDIVGRWNTTLTASYGGGGAWRGAALNTSWRYMRPTIELGVHAFDHAPSKGRDAVDGADSLDARGVLGVLSLSHMIRREGWRIGARAGIAGGPLQPVLGDTFPLAMGFVSGEVQLRQFGATNGAFERLQVSVTDGKLRTEFRRYLATLQLATTGDGFPLDVSATLGRHYGSRHAFSEFSLGGMTPATMDTALMTQRFEMAALPTGTARGRVLRAWRVAFPARYTLYFEGAAVGQYEQDLNQWHRAAGIEWRASGAGIPVAFTPAFQARVGVAFSIDRPLNDKFRAYAVVRFDP